jgi:hypothetical protein
MCGYDDVSVGVANRQPPGWSCQLALIDHFAIWLVGRRVNELAKCDYRFCPIETRLEVRNLILCTATTPPGGGIPTAVPAGSGGQAGTTSQATTEAEILAAAAGLALVVFGGYGASRRRSRRH